MKAIVSFLVCLTFSALAHSQDRLALVIANGQYDDPYIRDLPNAVNDGDALAETFRDDWGFEVIYAANADARELRDGLLRLNDRIAEAGPNVTLLVYLAGHGIQYDGLDILLPSDFALSEGGAPIVPEILYAPEPARSQKLGLALTDIFDLVEYHSAGGAKRIRTIVMTDACRENEVTLGTPGVRKFATGNSTYLSNLPTETMIVFATNPGGVVYDDFEMEVDGLIKESQHSPFAFSLMQNAYRGVYDFLQMMSSTTVSTMELTQGVQKPVILLFGWSNSNLSCYPNRFSNFDDTFEFSGIWFKPEQGPSTGCGQDVCIRVVNRIGGRDRDALECGDLISTVNGMSFKSTDPDALRGQFSELLYAQDDRALLFYLVESASGARLVKFKP